MIPTKWSNNLQKILDEEYLTPSSLANLCRNERKVSAKTIKQLAAKKHRGHLETWYRLVEAINQKTNKKKIYTAEDFLGPDYKRFWQDNPELLNSD